MSYIILKLTTGQEIIGKVSNAWNAHETDGCFQLNDPFEVKTQWSPQGELQMGLIPFLPYVEKNVAVFPPNGIVAIGEPVGALIKEYTKQTSGILIP
jgi:hypothetical protein